jgi:hypothetical protein
VPGHEAIRNAIHACIVTAFTHYYASAPRGVQLSATRPRL